LRNEQSENRKPSELGFILGTIRARNSSIQKKRAVDLAKITIQPVLYKPASVSRVRPSLGTIGYAEISGLAGTGAIDGPVVSRFAS